MKHLNRILIALALSVLSATSHAGALSDYLEQKLVDWMFRQQAYTPPATVYIALYTSACSDSAAGTEVSTSGTGYGRVGVAGSLANWAGTQSAGSTTASTGTGGTTSNNNAITYGAPTGNWGTVSHWGAHDASTAGNFLLCGTLTQAKTINNGDAAPSFGAGQLTIQVDN